MKELTYKFLITGVLFIFVMIPVMEKTHAFFAFYNLNHIVTGFKDGNNLIADLISYLLYLLFEVRFNDLESLLNYF
jgi:hypothetical protein